MKTCYFNEALKAIHEGHDLMFTFKSEAVKFATQAKLETIYEDGDLIDDEHLKVKGYNCNLYWITQ